MDYYAHTAEQALKKLGSSEAGLSKTEVARRQKQYGLNRIKVKSEPLWRKILEPFMDVFMLVLVVAAVISFWQNELLDGIIIASVMAVSAIIFYVQRFSTDRVLRSLSKHSAQSVMVWRDGEAVSVDSSQLVPGDIARIGEGDRVPADMRLVESANLRVDESQLTGESLPIGKDIDVLTGIKEVYEQSNMVFSGSFVVGGMAHGLVVATGNDTEFGNLASLSSQQGDRSPIQKKIDKLISKIVAVVGAVSVVTFVLALLRGMELLESLRFVMALAVSAVPEGLPIAISVVLVLGMRRMAAKKALVRQMRAIETVGTITTIATDKTGTLTENKLTVQQVWSPGSGVRVHKVMAHAVNTGGAKSHDPLDVALEAYARKKYKMSRQSPVEELPFDQLAAMSATVWHDGARFAMYLKGAPEVMLKRCKLKGDELKKAEQLLGEMTSQGYRVIGLASLDLAKPVEAFSELPKKANMKFEGLVAVADVLRPEAVRAIRTAERAGVTVRMITGDHFETAYQIGKQLGLVERRDQVFDCREMSKLGDDELEELAENVKVFSRVIPEQKYRLLGALKKRNITAMTGDGVNDVPALSNAHVGVAMGSGSQIAKDAGDIILLDDNFKTINDAMREGRVMVANVRNMLFYLLSTNTGELLTMLSALIIGLRVPLEPVQILWINLVTDTTMVIPLGFEPGDKRVMRQKPNAPNAPILNRVMVVRMVLIALLMAVLSISVYMLFSRSHGHEYAQTLVLIALVASQWANAFNARSSHESLFKRLRVMNRSFYVGLLISIGLQALVFFGPLGEMLHVVSVSAVHMVVVSAVSFVLPIAVCEVHKKLPGSKIS